MTEGKLLVHFDSERVSVYHSRGSELTLHKRERLGFDGTFAVEALAGRISEFCDGLKEFAEAIDNKGVRLYATGGFQRLSQPDVVTLVNSVFVDAGLYLNIVGPELERFYLETGMSASGLNDMMEGVVRQEFRSVVVCGSFQQSLGSIEDLISRLREKGTVVLSPWTTRIKPESVGTDFVLFDYQDFLKNERDTWRHKYIHLSKMSQADAVVVCNPGGRIGNGTLFELGFMSAISKRVIFTEEPSNVILFPCEVGLED